MIGLEFNALARIVDGTLLGSDATASRFTGVSIDSRSIQPGELFVAIRGRNHDGHSFIDQAIERGAVGVLGESRVPELTAYGARLPVVAVDDAHQAMMTLARDYRRRIGATIIGITGSNGKTTAKEMTFTMLDAVASDAYRSPGNFNNLYGMPLALLQMPDTTRYAVMEMGISEPGEMTRLTHLVMPDVIVLLNVGPSHLEFLRSVEGVARAKLEMVAASSPDTPVIVNADDTVLLNETRQLRPEPITFAIDTDAEFKPSLIKTAEDGGQRVTIDGHVFELALFGRHQVYNLLAAFAAFKTVDLDFGDVDTAGLTFTTAPMRGESVVCHGVTFFVDCYNANPNSVRSGLASFGTMPVSGRRIVILGDMLELGDASPAYHREAGRQAAAIEPDLLVLVGPQSSPTADAARDADLPDSSVRHYETADACASDILSVLEPGDTVYIKGSRGIALEKIVSQWEQKGGER